MTTEERQLAHVQQIQTQELSPYEPANLAAAFELCQMLCRSSLVPKGLENKPHDVLIVVAQGRDYGLSWPQALQNLYVVHGRVGAYAEFLRAAIQASPECEVFEISEATDEKAVVEVKKKGWTESRFVEFTIDEAIKARLAQRLPSGEIVGVVSRAGSDPKDSNWAKYTADMLVARATTRGKRRYFPGVLTQLPAVEELMDEPVEKNVTPQDEAAERAAKIVKAAKEVKAEPESEEPEPEPGPAGASIFESGEQQSEDEPPTPAEPSATPPTHETMADALAAELMKLPRVGQTTIEAMESAGALTAHQVVAFGNPSKLSAAVKGVGGQKAEHIYRRCEEILDEGDQLRENEPESAPEPEDEPEPAPEPAEPESEPPAAKATRFRSEEYVQALRELMGKQGVTFSQVKTYVTEKLGYQVSYWNDLMTLPDPEWKKLGDWIKSAQQTELPIDEEAEAEEKPAAKSEAVEYITAGRVRVLGETVEKMTAELSEKDKAAWMDSLANYLHEKHGVPSGQKMATKIPASAYLDVLGWLTDNDPRSA